METFNAIVIGSGLGGLTAGAFLARSGRKVLVLEQHYIPGGCATSFKRKDFIMEVGLHELDGLFEKDTKMQIFHYLEINRSIRFKQVPELFHYRSDQISFTFPHGLDEAQRALVEKFPHEKKGILKFLKTMNGVLEETPRIPREKWKLWLLYPFMPMLFPNMVKVSHISVGHWLDKHISDKQLKLILLGNLMYYSDDPYAMSFLYFSVAQAGYIGGGGHYIRGGSHRLSAYLVKVIEDHGGQVLLGKKVERILMNKKQATGVAFRDAFNASLPEREVVGDVVVGNAAIPLLAEMLPADCKRKLESRIRGLEYSCSLISIYMGFNRELKELGSTHYSTFFQGDNIESIADIKPNNIGDWKNKGFVFVDYSQVDSRLAPNGKSLGVICAVDYLTCWDDLDEDSYKAKKEEVANIFFQRLERAFPGIMEHLAYYEVGTSRTIRGFTLNPGGTPYGYAQKVSQAGMHRIGQQSPVKGLFFSSAWSFPGAGFTGTIVGGFLCALRMQKKVRWSRKQPELIRDKRIVLLIEKRMIADHTLELEFEKPEGLIYRPGQYGLLRINTPRYTRLDLPFRYFSFVSHPEESTIRFAMRISDSSFKQSCAAMEPGESATLFGPMGDLSLPEPTMDIVFLVSGIGITPVISLLREMEITGYPGRVILIYSNKSESSTAFHQRLQQTGLKDYLYKPVFTQKEGRINMEFLTGYLTDMKKYLYYLVGSSGFIRSMRSLLCQNGVELHCIRVDDFG